ncbi:hypothetical protein G647_01391 [Cladophialophora carrionii CBS 160.54]|uniref:Uncharacterized protein n=1 Tax=Cladophialophora carrionii CBS 160.54 TaxID=1279043 RepID=V9DPV5_9EURO|nr:uncharacterized protein G647_01391 [Cladophialophora carrionii CBS 160.54]ETI28939.1 hypothetical protein G647_01391 [Cladophialophora carrionii CBS 160.54]
MDPGSILGLLGSAGAITACIVGTLKDLTDLRAKFAVADTNIKLLKSELTAIKSALDRIHDWAKYNLEEDQTQAPKLGEGLGAILEGCRVAMEVLAEDVADLLNPNTLEQGQSHLRLGFRDKTRLIWHEGALRDHQERLSRQTGALHLLLTAIQCTNISEQTRLLRAPENRQKIQDVVDDTSTIRAARSQRASIASPSIKSGTSAIPSRAFPFDEELLMTDAYQHATQHRRSKSDSRRDPIPRRPDLNIQIQDHLPIDEGYDTMSKTTSDSTPSASHLSPTWSRGSTSRPLRPYETNPMRASDPGNVYKIQTTNLSGRFDSSSRPPYSPLQSPTVKTVDRKKSFWHSLRRKSDSAIDEHTRQQDIKSPIPGSQRGKKGFENKFHTSVDLSTPASKKCPPIVRAAQTGSIDDIESLLEAHADIEECYWPIGRNAMAVAAHCGNEEVVELLLRYGAKMSRKDSLHYTPLHLAASRGHVGVLQLLVSEDVPLEEKGPNDKTALRLSCDSGHLEAAEFLLAHGAKVNARDKSNLTSLHAAAQRGDLHTVALLIKYGAHVQAKDAKFMDALHYACDGGFNSVVELLLSKKIDIETPGNEGKTPLMTAASAGHAHTVGFLLKRKASLKSKGLGDMTALHWAAFNGHVEVVDLLAQKKAQINAVNVDGRTPLHLAVMAEHFAVVELLLRKNAALEAQCKDSFRPLHYACGFDNTDIALLLLRSGADVEASASAQNRPLHLAITHGNISNVTMLLEHGANIDARNAHGDRALLLASSHGHTEIVKVLLDRGAPLRSKFAVGPSHEDSPLCIAAKNGHSDVVDLLIGRGASVREKDEHAWQPLRYGAYYGHPEVVERLLAAGASISGIQTWGFNLTADRIGFAQNVNIPEDRKEHVMILLQNAEERERLIQESELARPPRRPVDDGGFPELDQATQPTHVELRSSTTRAGPGKLSRRFSYEAPSQSRSESQYSDSDQPQEPSYSVSPLPPGQPELDGRRNRSEPDAVSPLPHHMRAQSEVQIPASASSANMDTPPARTNSEHISSRYRDVTRRWREAVADRPNRSATVASNVYNLRRSEVSQPSAFSPGPSAMSYQTVSDMDRPSPGPAYQSVGTSFNTSSMPWSPDSITQPPVESVASPPPPPPPTRTPPPPPIGAESEVRPWQVMPVGRVEMG